ncbi:kinesin-like protein KIF25 isoform X2 [Vanacampus margaritifer]
MPLFVNHDQIFAHQVHLLELKLRAKEEQILELETQNAILRNRLTETLNSSNHTSRLSLAKVQEEREEKDSEASNPEPAVVQKALTRSAVAGLLSEVQALKGCLRDLFAIYVTFAAELEEKRKRLQENVEQQRCSSRKLCPQDKLENLQGRLAALERSLVEGRDKCRVDGQRRKEVPDAPVEVRGDIRVHCRLRPLLPLDRVQPSPSGCGSSSSAERVIHAISDVRLFGIKSTCCCGCESSRSSHRVHGPDGSQEDVFEDVKPLLGSLLDGRDLCILAYGQTGSGKTHTMMGDPESAEPSGLQRGVVVKAAAEIFRLISEEPSADRLLEVSVAELRNNDIVDLLAKDGGRWRDNVASSAASCQTASLTHERVCDVCQLTRILSGALRLRARCPTRVHADSSRSHLIVTLTLTSMSPDAQASGRRLQSAKKKVAPCGAQKEPECGPACHGSHAAHKSPEDAFRSPASSPCPSSPRSSPRPSPRSALRSSASPSPFRTKLQLVDLAGSECVDLSSVSPWELSCIKRSVSALWDVVSALAERRTHVPYRNSKLTHLLQDALGGDGKLLVMLCVSPARRFLSESLQTLSFGARARQVHRDPTRKKSHAPNVK